MAGRGLSSIPGFELQMPDIHIRDLAAHAMIQKRFLNN